MPDVCNRNQDQQGRNPDGRENVKHFGPLFVDQSENDHCQTQNPNVREPSPSLCSVLYSLTHNLSGSASLGEQAKGWLFASLFSR
jgi:hypothetical protein